MSRRKREHDEWHEFRVAGAAILTLLAILVVSELTDYDPPDPPAPVPPQSVEQGRREDAVRATRGEGRAEIPPGLSAPTPDASDRPEDAGKRQLSRPVVGLTDVMLCVREAESGGDYQAENPTSSASGAWQFIDSTWESVTGLPAPASAYPRDVQDAAAVELWAGGAGAGHWVTASGCGA